MVDMLRGYPPAVAWLESVESELLALPGYVVLELIAGCENRSEMNRLLRFLQRYRIVWPAAADCDRAIRDFAEARSSRKIGILDVLIAECSVGLDVPLYSFNLRHFTGILGLRTVQPYTKPT